MTTYQSSAPQQKTLFDLIPNSIAALPSRSLDSPEELNEEPIKAGSVAEPIHRGNLQEPSTAVAAKRLRASPETMLIHPFFIKQKPPAHSEKSAIKQHAILEVPDDDLTNVILRKTPGLPYEAGSQEDPIVLYSPVRSLRPGKPNIQSDKPLAPLFTSLPSMSSNSCMVRESFKQEHLATPYPDRLAQHVRGPQSTFHSPELLYERRFPHMVLEVKRASEQPLNYSEWTYKQNDFHISAFHPRQISVDQIPTENRQHPAILRLTNGSSSSSSQHLWADKWHPISAAEVLGNEGSAIYLRDWMRVLGLHLTTEPISRPDEVKNEPMPKARSSSYKRQRVVRAVAKHRGRKKQRVQSDDEDDWIVYSDSTEESDNMETGFDDYPFSSPVRYDRGLSPRSSFIPTPVSHPVSILQSSAESLTNTILLAGPSGVGKTAAVYACAKELGWDVLEVYPGIGKRNASSIDGLIGDAGKNHHVQVMKGEVTGEMTPDKAVHTQMHLESPTHSADANDSARAVRQSLILLEEADIQFKEDASFWPAVINFIKDCRRPVIITCNDISLIPTEDLPLQTVLHFQPCPPALATPYLDALCSAEGYQLERETLLQVYEGSLYKLEAIDLPDDSVPPMSCDFPMPDLRRTINYLQFFCSSADSEGRCTFGLEDTLDHVEGLLDWNKTTEEHKPRKSPDGVSADQGLFTTFMRTQMPSRRSLAARHAELISFVDSQMTRGGWDAEEAADSEPSNDDQVGHPILSCPRSSATVFSGSRTQDREIVSAVERLSRAEMTAGATREPMSIEIPFETRELFRARVDHRLQMKQGLGGVVPLSVLMVRHRTARLEYATIVRDIMKAEDEQEKVDSRRVHTGRRTRNSGRPIFERIYEFTDESRQALAGIVL